MMEFTPSTEARLRRIFKQFNRVMILLWRLGLASYGNPSRYGGAIMVIKHRGHRTGLTRYAPVNYAEVGNQVYCTAGFGAATHWYRNLQADPQVELWLPDSRWSGEAEDASDDPQRAALLRKVLVASGVAGPLVGVNPRRMSDAQIDALFATYRLIRIHKTAPITGPGGPGDLAWVWPLSTLLFLGLLLRRRRCS
jgi:deazaflavin-dependent oxidoreductase (nitroreductase family)